MLGFWTYRNDAKKFTLKSCAIFRSSCALCFDANGKLRPFVLGRNSVRILAGFCAAFRPIIPSFGSFAAAWK